MIIRPNVSTNLLSFPTSRRASSGGVILRHGSTSIEGKTPFLLPFISDEVSASIRKCLKRSGLENLVAIVNVPPNVNVQSKEALDS